MTQIEKWGKIANFADNVFFRCPHSLSFRRTTLIFGSFVGGKGLRQLRENLKMLSRDSNFMVRGIWGKSQSDLSRIVENVKVLNCPVIPHYRNALGLSFTLSFTANWQDISCLMSQYLEDFVFGLDLPTYLTLFCSAVQHTRFHGV